MGWMDGWAFNILIYREGTALIRSDLMRSLKFKDVKSFLNLLFGVFEGLGDTRTSPSYRKVLYEICTVREVEELERGGKR